MEETTIWKGSPSHVVNLGTYALCLVASAGIVVLALVSGMIFLCGLLLIPVGIALWKWIQIKCRSYDVTTERVRTGTGVFTRRTDELELYRVKDTTLIQPFHYRLFSAGNIILSTTDQTTPNLTLEAVKKPAELREQLRKNIELCRERKRVRMTELE